MIDQQSFHAPSYHPGSSALWSSWDIEKCWPGAHFVKSPDNFSGCETANRLLWKADLLTCFKGNKKKNGCEVWRLKSSPFFRYKGNCVTRKWPVKFRDFRETDPRLPRGFFSQLPLKQRTLWSTPPRQQGRAALKTDIQHSTFFSKTSMRIIKTLTKFVKKRCISTSSLNANFTFGPFWFF